jgi:hypothetical protein
MSFTQARSLPDESSHSAWTITKNVQLSVLSTNGSSSSQEGDVSLAANKAEEQALETHEVIELQLFSERKVWIEEKIEVLCTLISFDLGFTFTIVPSKSASC